MQSCKLVNSHDFWLHIWFCLPYPTFFLTHCFRHFPSHKILSSHMVHIFDTTFQEFDFTSLQLLNLVLVLVFTYDSSFHIPRVLLTPFWHIFPGVCLHIWFYTSLAWCMFLSLYFKHLTSLNYKTNDILHDLTSHVPCMIYDAKMMQKYRLMNSHDFLASHMILPRISYFFNTLFQTFSFTCDFTHPTHGSHS